jgi:hypothetical protein
LISLARAQPVVLEEFGMARDEWQNVAKGAPKSFYLYEYVHLDRLKTFISLHQLGDD